MPRLAPVPGARLGGALSPLSSRTRKQWSLASSGAPDLFPGLPPSSPWRTSPLQAVFTPATPVLSLDPTSEARASAPSPCAPQRGSRQASRAGECWSVPLLHAGISPLCPLHPCGCALLRGSEAPPSATRSLRPRRGSWCVETFPPSQLPPTGAGPVPILLSLFFLFSFALPRYVGSFLPFGDRKSVV